MRNGTRLLVNALALVLVLATCSSAQQFRLPPQYSAGIDPLGVGPNSIAVGDFNADGKLDLAVTHNDGSEVSILLGKGDGTFQPPMDYQTGYAPAALVVGDFNGDGFLDLAISCGGVFFDGSDGAVSILMGNGDGTFQFRVDYALGSQPFTIATADFNGDGAADLVVSMGPASSIKTTSVLLNAGDGTFHVLEAFPGGTVLAAGDFNGDGKADLAVGVTQYVDGEPLQNWVNILLSKGDGTFQAASANYDIPGFPFGSVSADLDGDGRLDLAVASSSFVTTPQPNIISVFIGNGDGTLKNSVDYPSNNSGSLIAADISGDGHLDLVAGTGDTVSIFPGNGNGTFQAPVLYLVPGGPLVAADLNGDGRQDLAVVDYSGNAVSVLLNTGGPFSTAPFYLTGHAPGAVAVADVNGDGKQDLVVANGGPYSLYYSPDNTISVLLGNGDGTFQPRSDYPTGVAPLSVAVADLNGDGKPDVVTANLNANSVSVLLNQGNGTFRMPVDYPTASFPRSVVIGDFNKDGKMDLAVAAPGEGVVSVLLGNGDGTFRSKVDYATGTGPITVAIGDFNGDGKLDLATANVGDPDSGIPPTLSVLLGNGDGTFGAHVDYNPGGPAWFLAVADLNGDNKQDIVVANGGCSCVLGGLGVFMGRGDGTFQPVVSYGAGGGPSGVVVADLNGDGKLDLAVANGDFADNSVAYGTSVSVLWGNGDGTFRPHVDYEVGFGSYALAAGDFNGDHKPDLAVVAENSNGVVALLNSTTVSQFVLTAEPPYGGTLQSSPVGINQCGFSSECTAAFDSGTTVTVDASLQAGFNLGPWSGDCPGSGACVVHMAADRLVTATSVPITTTFQLNLNIAGNGVGVVEDSQLIGDACSRSCVLNFPSGAIIPLGGVAIPGNTFAGWSTPACAKTVDCFVTMNSNVSITATFTLPAGSHELTVQATGTGTGYITSMPGAINCGVNTLAGITFGPCEAGFSGGNSITLTFTPDPGYILTGWSGGGCSGTGNCILTLSSNQTVTATLAPMPDFSMSASTFTPSPVSPGQSATASITLAAANRFNSSASLTCAVSPLPQFAPQCSVNPGSIDQNTPATVTVTTIAPTAAMRSPSGRSDLLYAVFLPLISLAFGGILLPARKTSRLLWVFLGGGMLITAILLSACGGGGGGGSHHGSAGTPPGDYTITITGTSGSLLHTTSVTLTVQ